MKILAALLLTVLAIGAALDTRTPIYEDSHDHNTQSPSKDKISNAMHDSTTPNNELKMAHAEADGSTSSPNMRATYKTTSPLKKTSRMQLNDPLLDGHVKSLLNPKEMLLEEIRTLDEEATNSKMQEEVAQTLRNEAQKEKSNVYASSMLKPVSSRVNHDSRNSTEDSAMKKLLEAEHQTYDDDSGDAEDEDDDMDDEYDVDDSDEILDEEEVMTQCPHYCKCVEQYAAAMTATCRKLIDEQSFGTGIAHLRVENAGEIRLGPHALRSWGLQQLESISIVDTRIIDLDQTAFDGITYLFAVNLTRNGLQDIHPKTFENNTQLSLLAISGNPLKHTQDLKLGKYGLFDAPSITEFDFSNNGLTKLKRNAFARMPSLVYINLRGNRLKEIDSNIFNSLESLIDVDLSNNLLNDISVDLFYNKGVQTLRVSGNNLTTLATIRAPKLTVLEAANNRIKVVAKDDLAGVPLLDQLNINSNGIKRIHQHAFADLDQLTYLDISNNKLTSLTEHHFRTNSRLQVLLLSDNPGLQSLPVFKVTGMEYDTFSVYRFECANCGLSYLEEGTFDAMPGITRLNLSKNRLSRLPNGLFNRLSSLRVLDLSDNVFHVLETNMFRGATSLTKLSLAGNSLVTLQVTPFLMTPSLLRLDVSRCILKRVWSEARFPLTSLRFLSVRKNLLRRITVEELKATPKISGLDLSHNPFDCDAEFNEAVQWLTDHGVTPKETLKYSSYDNDDYSDSEGISQWTDLAKVVCDGVEDGPPSRSMSHKDKKPKEKAPDLEPTDDDSDAHAWGDFEGDEELRNLHFPLGVKHNSEVENVWSIQDQEYVDLLPSQGGQREQPWYNGAVWPVIIVVLVTLMVLLLTAHIAVYLAKRRGRGPVIRPPLMLRQGLMDNKNCGLVYKPLQEEIATPHMPKRGSFYSSSTFHYDKIVPESV